MRVANLNNNKKDFLVPIDHHLSIDPNYISGFCNGDGTTSLVTKPDSFHEGFGRATLSIGQHVNNLSLLEAIRNYFGVGSLVNRKNLVDFVVSNKTDLQNVIIPFFDKHPFYGAHAISFLKWKTIITYL